MTIARAGERPARSVVLRWDAGDDQVERDSAAEMVAALATVVERWIEPLAIEGHVGCYDREIFTEGQNRPAERFHVLVRSNLPAGLEVRPRVHAVWARAESLSPEAVRAWVDTLLAQPCGDPARFETSLRELDLRRARFSLPPGFETGETLALDCYAGTISIPIEREEDTAWLGTVDPDYGLRQPVAVTINNNDGWCSLAIHIYWSPWVAELDRPDSPLSLAIARLAARGWRPDD